MKTDKEKLDLLRSKIARPPCLDSLRGEVIFYQSEPPKLKMEFEAIPEFCHSPNQIVQGGFVTGMLDSAMAHLVIAYLDFEFNPISLDINVSFLESSHPGILIAESRIKKLGKNIGYLSSEIFQNDKLVAASTSTVKLVSMSRKPLL
jgi:acyl-CoA thioesterase|tara:strand:+ start:60 stop:500 length:441 start_codon:yes stop_codon:yes gene_type:complete